jgi:hypothetical protein
MRLETLCILFFYFVKYFINVLIVANSQFNILIVLLFVMFNDIDFGIVIICFIINVFPKNVDISIGSLLRAWAKRGNCTGNTWIQLF